VNDEPPPDFTLEELADDAGVDPETVREWLRREVERRQRERQSVEPVLAPERAEA
jgi:hypothetical protein